MTKLLWSCVSAIFFSSALAQVGINTSTPQSTLDVNGSIQLRDELRINGSAGAPGEIYFSRGISNDPQWATVNVPFLEDGQYQLVNTYAISDEVGIDFIGYSFSCANPIKTFPFIETFETNSPTISCWNQFEAGPGNSGGTSAWTFASAGDGGTTGTPNGNVRNTAKSGTRNARFVTTNNKVTKMITPTFDLTNVANPKVRFWYGQRASGTNQNTLRVYYRTSSNGAWTQVGLTPSSFTGNIVDWTEVTLNLPNKSANYQIAFEGVSVGGRANVIDDIEVYGDAPTSFGENQNLYNPQLSSLGESITAKNWTRIPGLDLPITIGSDDNKISVILQTGAESKLSSANSGNQTAGNVRFTCGLFRRSTGQPVSNATLVALRGSQVNNVVSKPITSKAQSIFTLTYTVDNTPSGDYTFSVACRRNLLSSGGGGSQETSLLSIGTAINSSGQMNDFMLNSILKMDIIELVTIVSEP